MGSMSIWHWLIVLAVVLLLFGGSGKISTLMGDMAKGIKSFKKNMGEDESMEGSAPPASGAIPPPQQQYGQQQYGQQGYSQPVYPPQGQAPVQAPGAQPHEPVRHG